MKSKETKRNSMKHNLICLSTSLIFIGLLPVMILAAENTWTTKADMPTARGVFGVSEVNGKIYVIGGHPTDLPTVEAYDPKTDTWERKADMPTPRAFLTTSAVNGKIYAIGGASLNKRIWFNTVEEYDPVTDTWSKKANMPTARNWLATCVVKGKIYAIGGWNSSTFSTVEEYDPQTDTWTRKADMPTKRWGLTAGVANGKIYVIGGAIGWNPLSAVEEYDPVTNTWTRKANLAQPSAWMANSSPTVNEKIYVMGGWSEHFGPISFATLKEYNPVMDTWTERADMPTARGILGGAEVDGKIYAIGGLNGAPLSTVEEYDTGIMSTKSIEAEGKLATTWGKVKRSR